MSTQFFERQEAQKSYTRWLVWAFIAAVLAVVIVINLIVVIGFGIHPATLFTENLEFVLWTSTAVILTILGACWHKTSEMRAGGAVVARSLGGEPVTAEDADARREAAVRERDPRGRRYRREARDSGDDLERNPVHLTGDMKTLYEQLSDLSKGAAKK